MSEPKSADGQPPVKRIMERPFLSGLVVPTAIVLVAAVIIFGVTKMLSTSKSHRDLIEELQSKRFGNRWVAAYELSKVLNTKKFSPEEGRWIGNSLIEIFKSSRDARTKNFVVLAIGSLKSQQSLSFLIEATQDPDQKVVFSAIAAIGNFEQLYGQDLKALNGLFESKDTGAVQALQFALAQHRLEWARENIERNLIAESQALRYSAAIALINYKSERALPTLNEILSLSDTVQERGPNVLDAKKRLALKLNVLNLLAKEK